jgi:hypothetical protein
LRKAAIDSCRIVKLLTYRLVQRHIKGKCQDFDGRQSDSDVVLFQRYYWVGGMKKGWKRPLWHWAVQKKETCDSVGWEADRKRDLLTIHTHNCFEAAISTLAAFDPRWYSAEANVMSLSSAQGHFCEPLGCKFWLDRGIMP